MWFTLHPAGGEALVGLATVCAPKEAFDSGGSKPPCQLDGFISRRSLTAPNWRQLVLVALRWARRQGFVRCRARVSSEDVVKAGRFQALGFAPLDPVAAAAACPEAARPFVYRDSIGGGDREVPALLLQVAIADVLRELAEDDGPRGR